MSILFSSGAECFHWQEIMQHKLVFIETQDVVETTLALDNYRKACDCGRGAIFFSVARYDIDNNIYS